MRARRPLDRRPGWYPSRNAGPGIEAYVQVWVDGEVVVAGIDMHIAELEHELT